MQPRTFLSSFSDSLSESPLSDIKTQPSLPSGSEVNHNNNSLIIMHKHFYLTSELQRGRKEGPCFYFTPSQSWNESRDTHSICQQIPCQPQSRLCWSPALFLALWWRPLSSMSLVGRMKSCPATSWGILQLWLFISSTSRIWPRTNATTGKH